MKKRKISIVIPIYNENENIRTICSELDEVRRTLLANYDFEVLLMDNHSTDNSFAIATEIAENDPSTRVIRLSRNFGYQANILTGFMSCSGDAVVQLDSDGEDDPKIIAEMVKHWEAGQKVVYGVRTKRHEGAILTLQRKVFYRLIQTLSSVPLPVDAGDFRLLDRQVVEALRGFKEASPYLRGLIAYAGFNQIGIPYERRPRYRGESKFSWFAYLALAWDGITSFSRKPLMLATVAGMSLSAASFLGAIFYFFFHFIVGTKLPGFSTLILVQLFLAGVQLLCLGLMGEYIGRIFEEVKSRPRSIIEASLEARSNGKGLHEVKSA